MTREEMRLIMAAVDQIRLSAERAGSSVLKGQLAASILASREAGRVRRNLANLLESMCDDD